MPRAIHEKPCNGNPEKRRWVELMKSKKWGGPGKDLKRWKNKGWNQHAEPQAYGIGTN